MNGRYLLGIDGGGTKTVFRLTDQHGTILNTVYKGATNPNDIGMEQTMAVLAEGIQEVCQGIPYSEVSMFAGISGGGLTGDNGRVLKEFFQNIGFYAFGNGSDIENVTALTEEETCILVIMGTGFVVYVLDGARRKKLSGWGQLFDEGGCGYTLGRDAVTAVLRASEGSGEQTILTELLERQIGESAQMHVGQFYQGGKRYIAGFAELVFTAAKQKDQVAQNILERNMAFTAHIIHTAAKDIKGFSSIPVLFAGGISTKHEILFPMIQKYLKTDICKLSRLEQEPVEGAIRRAKQISETKEVHIC